VHYSSQQYTVYLIILIKCILFVFLYDSVVKAMVSDPDKRDLILLRYIRVVGSIKKGIQ